MHINIQTLTNFCRRSTTCIHGLILLNTGLHLLFGFCSWQRHLILMAETTSDSLICPPHPVIVANVGLFIRIPDPKHVRILVVTINLGMGISDNPIMTPEMGKANTRKLSSRLASWSWCCTSPVAPNLPSTLPSPRFHLQKKGFWKCPFLGWAMFETYGYIYIYISHHIINTDH